jgi:2-keto-4-pentenoate hydratase/2-oxohepta-3-ene-1,7-dioic acid hydratase in catechol pathway
LAKIVRVRYGDDIAYGLAEMEGVTLYEGSPFVVWEATETMVGWDEVKVLSPVLPTKVVGVGGNYADPDDYRPSDPYLFLKPTTSVVGLGTGVAVPPMFPSVTFEAALAVVMGRVARRVRVEDAGAHILGYTVANDVTAPDLGDSLQHLTRAKGFDTFCPLGPMIETEFDPLEQHPVDCLVNDDLRQSSLTSEVVYGPGELVSYVSSVMTLLPGDVILTGPTEGGVSVYPGEIMEVRIEGVGALMNPVVRG